MCGHVLTAKYIKGYSVVIWNVDKFPDSVDLNFV